ncbi:MAG: helix-turn-helix domain-containing protein, partial [Oscillospiraceae bacterium]|nr:helix-turn-helix domain-containing protein [Oscillospiraceae bacterium]
MLCDRLKQARKGKRLSQEDLATALNVVRQTVSKWEKGTSVPDAEMLLRLAQVLDVPVNALLDDDMDNGEEKIKMRYDVIIIGAGPGGIFAAYELMQHRPELKVAVFESGHALDKRRCPIDGEKIKNCIGCKSCSIMSGFGGAGAFSDGKYNITNDFGGTLYEYIGKKQALELMRYVDDINMRYGGEGTKLYSTAGTRFKTLCIQNDLHLLDASVRHLGTDINYVVLENLYAYLKDKVQFFFDTPVLSVAALEEGYEIRCKDATYRCPTCIISVGRSGSKWMETVCRDLAIPTKSNRVDIGVRVELPAAVFAHLTDELYESKIVYRTEKYGDKVRTFCMNPKGAVVNENTNGIITVNGHSYEDPARQTENTNFALLVAKHFSEPFKDSNGYGESIARLSNMLGGGVIVQRFGDLIRGRRSTPSRIEEAFITPTLNATPGDLSLVLPKRILDGIIEMIYALDKV